MNFFKNMFSKDQPESAKRFFGGLGFTAAIVVICFLSRENIVHLLDVSALLIAGGIVENLINKKL
jgi:hypothetical protein